MSLAFQMEWVSGGDVQLPEARAAWCSLKITVGGRPVTVVQSESGGARTSISISAYPLAEWLVENWFTVLEYQQRADRLEPHGISLRGVGEGLCWPDLRFTAEGSVVRCQWHEGPAPHGGPVTFLTSGSDYVSYSAVERAFSEVVESVLARLHDEGIHGTLLERRWRDHTALTQDELEFVKAAAHLGLDPLDTTTEQEDGILHAADHIDSDLLLPLLDSTDVRGLTEAVAWIERARSAIAFADSVVEPVRLSPPDFSRAWEHGYAGAREIREMLSAQPLEAFPVERYVALATLGDNSAGVEAYSATHEGRTGLVLPGATQRPSSERFSRARALGYWALFEQSRSVMPPTHEWHDQASRAFAAELLLPSEDLQYIAQEAGRYWTGSIQEQLAERYQVSPAVVARQVENHNILAGQP